MVAEPLRDDEPQRPVGDERGPTDATAPDDAPDEVVSDEVTGDDAGKARDRASTPPGPVESVIGALLDAGPEVTDHVVRAAQELVLAAQALVEAAQRAVHEQQDLRRRPETADEDDATVHRHDRSE